MALHCHVWRCICKQRNGHLKQDHLVSIFFILETKNKVNKVHVKLTYSNKITSIFFCNISMKRLLPLDKVSHVDGMFTNNNVFARNSDLRTCLRLIVSVLYFPLLCVDNGSSDSTLFSHFLTWIHRVHQTGPVLPKLVIKHRAISIEFFFPIC